MPAKAQPKKTEKAASASAGGKAKKKKWSKGKVRDKLNNMVRASFFPSRGSSDDDPSSLL